MANIEIRNSQYVPLQYQLAGLRPRITAYLIDLMIQAGFILVFLLMDFSELGLFLISFYAFAFEWSLSGQTPGKKLIGIRVIKPYDQTPTWEDYFIRWIFRLVEVMLSLGTLAVIGIAASDYRQRFGDRIAGTIVVFVKDKSITTERKVLDKLAGYTSASVVYSEAAALSEAQARLIQTTLQRYRRYGGEGHREAIERLAARLAQYLDVVHLERDSGNHDVDRRSGSSGEVRFLSQVLRDYVVLSR